MSIFAKISSRQILFCLLIASGGVIVAILLANWYFSRSLPPQESLPQLQTETDLQIPLVLEKDLIIVEIQGAIAKPGVYQLPKNSRVNTLVERAGGITKQVDTEWLQKSFNQAKILKDGDKVFITIKEESVAKKTTTTKKK